MRPNTSNPVKLDISPIPAPPPPRTLDLVLIRNSDGSVDVKGGEHYLIRFRTDGTIMRFASVSDDLGLKLDSDGYIEVDE